MHPPHSVFDVCVMLDISKLFFRQWMSRFDWFVSAVDRCLTSALDRTGNRRATPSMRATRWGFPRTKTAAGWVRCCSLYLLIVLCVASCTTVFCYLTSGSLYKVQLLHSVNLIVFTLLLVHLILHISPHHSHHLRSHHPSLPLHFTPDLKLISFTNPFLHSHSYSFRTDFMDLNLYWIKGALLCLF